MGTIPEDIEKKRIEFINNCISHDKPRLESEQYVDDVTEVPGIAYLADGTNEHTLDIYEPTAGVLRADKAFVLIHGGAFVYGMSTIDKCFGMSLSSRSGLRVFNVNYRLLPDTDIIGSVSDICRSIAYIHDNYGIKKIYVTGDSAGGYLALMVTLCHVSRTVREGLGITVCEDVAAGPAGLICGVYRMEPDVFPGIYLAGQDRSDKVPGYIYDLGEAVRLADPDKLQLILVTGDEDYLREDSRYMKALCDELGIRSVLLDQDSAQGRIMHHVYPISDPYWPESQAVIDLIARSAVGGQIGE